MHPAEPERASPAFETAVRWVEQHRRGLAAGFAGLALWATLSALTPGPGATVPVLTAARDLSWGRPIGPGDVITVWLPAARAPGNVLREADQALGHRPASPVRRGEPITDVRLLDDAVPGSGGSPDSVAAPIRLADPAVADLLRAGMTVDVLAVPADGFAPAASPAGAELVGAGLRVLSVRTSDSTDPGSGALVVVATTAETAARLAGAQAGGRLSVTWPAGR